MAKRLSNLFKKPLRIGSEAPNFRATSTPYTAEGRGTSTEDFQFHEFIYKRWVVFFSHPCDFTPVCTTEIAAFAEQKEEFDNRGTRLVGLSVGTVDNHNQWISGIHSAGVVRGGHRITFPIIGDEKGDVARKYDMLDKEEHPTNQIVSHCRPDLHTVRSVFIIDPKKIIRAIMTYPMEVGRSVTEIIRVLDALQARAANGTHIVTPVNWEPGQQVLLRPENDETDDGRWGEISRPYSGLKYMKFIDLRKDLIPGYTPLPETPAPYPRVQNPL